MLRKMISFVLRFWLFLRYRRSHYNTNAVAKHFVVVLQSLSRARLFATPWTIFTRPPCPSPPPRVCPSSYSLHQWCHLATSSSDALFSFCPQSFPASGTFPVSHLFASDTQNTGASASASVSPVNIQGWSPLRLTGLISLLSKGLSGAFSSTTIRRHQYFGILPFLQSSSHNHMWPVGRPSSWLYRPLSTKWCLFFSTYCLGL